MTLKEILRHIRDVHRHFTTPVRCGINDYLSTARTYDNLRQHLYKKHGSDLVALAAGSDCTCDPTMSQASDEVASAAGFIDVAKDYTRRETASEHTFALTNALGLDYPVTRCQKCLFWK